MKLLGIVKNVLFLLITFLFIGCAGTFHDFDTKTGIYQENIFDNSLFAPNTKLSRYWECPRLDLPHHPRTVNIIPELKDCKLIDQRFSSSSGSFGMLAGAGVALGGAAIIADGIRDSGDTINQSTGNLNCKGNCGPRRGFAPKLKKTNKLGKK